MNQKDLKLWQNRLTARKSSGLSIVDWCAKNNISKDSYYYWRKRVLAYEREGESGGPAPIFAELHPIPASVSTPAEPLEVFWQDLRFTIASTDHASLAAAVIRQLREPC